jgi:hypothetical protein
MPQTADDRSDLDAAGVADTEPPPASSTRLKTTARRPTLLGGFQPPPVAPGNEATLRAAGLSPRPIRAPR